MNNSQRGSLVWHQGTQGQILGSYYFGYATTQIIGGRYANQIGARILVASGILVGTLVTFATPFAAAYSEVLLIALRVVMGMAHGFVYSPLYGVFNRWFPKNEIATALR